MNVEKNHFLDHPDVIILTKDIFPKLIEESDRGAVIIGADVVESQLRMLLEKVMVKNMSNGMKKKLFDYVGPLGNFSSKIDIAYAFGYIDSTIKYSADALRCIRNNAAHTNKNFSLNENSEHLRKIYNLGDHIPIAVNKWALDFLIHNFIQEALCIKIPEESEPVFKNPKDVIDYISSKPELLKPLEDKRHRTEFGIGLVLLCAMIIYKRD